MIADDDTPLPDVLRLLRDGEISLGRALELVAPRVVEWQRGFPPRSGMYLVDLGHNEYVVTPYAVPGDEGVDTWGDPRGVGWKCLTGSHARVRAWARIPRTVSPTVQTPVR